MTDKAIYWASLIFSVLALLLFIFNTALINGNRALQQEIGSRQTAISTGAKVSPLNQQLAQTMAEMSIKDNDVALRDLLATQGISVRQPDKAKETGKADTGKKKQGE